MYISTCNDYTALWSATAVLQQPVCALLEGSMANQPTFTYGPWTGMTVDL